MTVTSPIVSVVVPCRNEKEFISRCLDSIIDNGYPTDHLQILVVDGMSSDGTRGIVLGYASRYPFVRLVDNPSKTTPVALNIGIQHSIGDFVLIMSAHATYDKQAIEKMMLYSSTYGAENVGGIWKIIPRDNGLLGRAIVTALSHRFGIGGATYRLQNKPSQPVWVDTAAYGCYRREVFSQIGGYNEKLVHSQDMELNLRLNSAGGRTLLAPDVVVRYFARTDLKSFLKHNYRNGQWVILPFGYSDVIPVAWRHLVPFVFVSSVAATAAAGMVAPKAWLLTSAIVLLYTGASVAASAQVAWHKRSAIYLLVMPVVFATLHFGHGIGAIVGAVRLVSLRCFWKKLLCPHNPQRDRVIRAYSDER